MVGRLMIHEVMQNEAEVNVIVDFDLEYFF